MRVKARASKRITKNTSQAIQTVRPSKGAKGTSNLNLKSTKKTLIVQVQHDN
jgi:hypothetical protein